jgi:hypothetical protein
MGVTSHGMEPRCVKNHIGLPNTHPQYALGMQTSVRGVPLAERRELEIVRIGGMGCTCL